MRIFESEVVNKIILCISQSFRQKSKTQYRVFYNCRKILTFCHQEQVKGYYHNININVPDHSSALFSQQYNLSSFMYITILKQNNTKEGLKYKIYKDSGMLYLTNDSFS